MLDTILSDLTESVRRYTAFRGRFSEILSVFAILMLARLAAAVWDGIVLDGGTVWIAWWNAYDNAGSFAADSVAVAVAFTATLEGSFAFLARKLIATAREDGREEGHEAGRAEVRAELEPIIKDLQERIRRLENGDQATPSDTAEP